MMLRGAMTAIALSRSSRATGAWAPVRASSTSTWPDKLSSTAGPIALQTSPMPHDFFGRAGGDGRVVRRQPLKLTKRAEQHPCCGNDQDVAIVQADVCF
jgi:hypothetical protein